jgi:predicted RNase H-like nuclease (RuvC/YqgF family)
MKYSSGGVEGSNTRNKTPYWALFVAGAALLGGCVSQATYEEAVQDARQAREGAARYESSQRDVKIGDLQVQMLNATIQFQSELRRQVEAQQTLANELIRLRQATDRQAAQHGKEPAGASSELALQERIRELEKQQQAAATRAEALESELRRLQTGQKDPRSKKTIQAVELDLIDPWR